MAPGGHASGVRSGAKGCQRPEHASVRPWVVEQAKLVEDVLNVKFDRAVGNGELLADRPVRATFGNKFENLSLTVGEGGNWVVTAPTREQRRHDAALWRVRGERYTRTSVNPAAAKSSSNASAWSIRLRRMKAKLVAST